MISTTGRAGLKAALYAHRKQMGRAARGRPRKPTRWLYPWATERRYAAAIRAWLRPMMEYVHEYLKNNQEAILRGDSAALTRQDATPGGSYTRMVKSLNGWYTTYIPPLTDFENRGSPPIVYMGLGSIAESMNDFNSAQWEKAAKAELGVEFPVYEDWWPETRRAWQTENYRLIQNMAGDYISRINMAAERAVTSGMSPAQLSQAIQKIDGTMKSSRANLIARDQIGKLNGLVTQARMEAVGLDLYEWSTSGDERVRGDPDGPYKDAVPSHAKLDGKLCRWDDSSVYSEDGGKTWKDRPADCCQLHPGQDIQCRCTALAYWQEIIGEVDQEIDLLSQEGDNAYSGAEGLRVMDKPPVKSKDELLIQQREAAAAHQLAENQAASEKLAKQMFPNETFVNVDSIKLDHVEIPKDAGGIQIAKGKLPVNLQEELDLLKEIKSAAILKSKEASVILIPRIRRPDGKGFVPGPDAIVNGSLFEFKTITGKLNKIGRRFRYSRKQGDNVYIRIENDRHTKAGVVNYLARLINNSQYQGGYKGKIILTVGSGQNEKTYFLTIKDLKR